MRFERNGVNNNDNQLFGRHHYHITRYRSRLRCAGGAAFLEDIVNEYEYQLFIIQSAIKELPEHERMNVEQCAATIRELIDRFGAEGQIALALVGAEKAAEAE